MVQGSERLVLGKLCLAKKSLLGTPTCMMTKEGHAWIYQPPLVNLTPSRGLCQARRNDWQERFPMTDTRISRRAALVGGTIFGA